MADPESTTEIGRLPLVEEVTQILRRRRVSGHVRVAVTTAEEARAIDAVLHHRRAEIERVPIGRDVESAPPIRQEGDTIVIPVLEERVELVRRLVLAEEIRFRLRTEEEAVSLPVTLRRQSFAVERSAADTHDDISGEDRIMSRTLIAMFDSHADAERAAEALRGLNVQASGVQVHESGTTDAGYGTIGGSWMPEEDRASYTEGLRRGGCVLTAEIAEGDMELAMDAMEAAGAVDLDQREATWRSEGWTGGIASGASDGTADNPPGTMASRAVDQVAGTNVSGAHPENETSRTGTSGYGTASTTGTTAAAGAATGREESIELAEERLRIGKRVAHAGRVRVRSYVVETPVEEQVMLREEHVRVERHAADRAATGSDAELFRDRVIEAEESVEEAVVQKDVRITGEVVVNKDSTERTATVRDTVRRTEVEVDEDATANDRVRRGDKGVA